MDAELSPEQELLRDSVRRFLAARAPIAPYVRDHIGTGTTGHDNVWAGLADLGVHGLLVPEEHGGAGMQMVDVAVVLEELGRAVCPAPFASSAVAAVTAVLEAGGADDRRALLPGLAAGSTIGTVALLEPERAYAWRRPATVARLDGDRWSLDGLKVHVPDAAAADLLLVTARDTAHDGALAVFAVDPRAGGTVVEPTSTVDASRFEASVRLAGAPARRLGGAGATSDAPAAIARTVELCALASAVDALGAASRALELAVDYAKVRVQFDKPIGSFQAVQHLCADMLRTVELGKAVCYYACWAVDNADASEAHRATTMAKAYTSDAFAQLGGNAIQVFGGLGFTWEHDIHLYYKRMLGHAVLHGGSDEHLAALADLLL